MVLEDAWTTKMELMDSSVNVSIIAMENTVNTKNTVRINVLRIRVLKGNRNLNQLSGDPPEGLHRSGILKDILKGCFNEIFCYKKLDAKYKHI